MTFSGSIAGIEDAGRAFTISGIAVDVTLIITAAAVA